MALISLDRESFLEVIQQFKLENKEKLDTLRQVLPYFDRISSQQTIDNLMYSFKDEARSHGNYLALEGDLGESVWLLASGEINIYKFIEGRNFLLGVISEK